MRVQVFSNLSGSAFRLTWEGYISPDDGDTERLLDEIMIHFSREDRPNAAIRPRFGRGDLITLEGGPRSLFESHWYTGEGWRKLSKTRRATGHEKLSLVAEQREAGVKAVVRISRLEVSS